MTKMIRYSALLLALLCCVPLLWGCGQDKRAVATWGDYEIPYEYIRFATLNFKVELDELYGDGNSENGTIWDDPAKSAQYAPLLEERVWNMVRDNYAVLAACEQYGIGKEVFDSDEVQDAVDASMKALRAEYATTAAYQEALKDSYMTEDVFRFYFGIEEMKTQLLEAMKAEQLFMTDKEEFYNWLLDGNCVYVQHVAQFLTENSDAEAARQVLGEVHQKLVSGEWSIEDAIDSPSNADTANTKPYFITRHIYEDALVDAALDLNRVGEVSPVIELEDALYILVRMEEDEDALAGELGTLLSLYQWAIVGEAVEQAKGGITFEKTDFGKELDLLAIE